MTATRIGTLAVRWIMESPRAREELRQVEPMMSIMAAMRLLDASFEGLVQQDAHTAHAIADLLEQFQTKLTGVSDAAW